MRIRSVFGYIARQRIYCLIRISKVFKFRVKTPYTLCCCIGFTIDKIFYNFFAVFLEHFQSSVLLVPTRNVETRSYSSSRILLLFLLYRNSEGPLDLSLWNMLLHFKFGNSSVHLIPFCILGEDCLRYIPEYFVL